MKFINNSNDLSKHLDMSIIKDVLIKNISIDTRTIKKNALFIHLTFVPFLKSSDEIKTKPTQHSVKELRSIGIQPDIVICRSQQSIPLDQRRKISLFCNVDIANVIETVDVKTIYEAPISLSLIHI